MNDEITESTAGKPGKDARTWAMICHLAAFSGFIIPFGSLLGPLIVWAIKKDEDPFINDQGKEAINFQLTLLIGFVISIILMFVFIGILLIAVLVVYCIIMVIIAAMKANEGELYRYPYTIRFFK
jgi:hypothetical protein